MSDYVIEVINMTKHFKNKTVLKDVSIGLEKGKIYGFIGRNGSGKTVLLKCICGFTPISEGDIVIQGKSLKTNNHLPSNLGVLIDAPGFLPTYSGYKNLELLAMIHRKISKYEIEEVINTVGLDPKSKMWVSKYSLGMKQRLAIAQAIMEQPDILILDEPMNGLDTEGIAQMHKLFRELAIKGVTLLIATHIKEDIENLCDEVYKIENGSVKSTHDF